MPTYLLEILGLRSPAVKLYRRGVARLPVNPHGITPVGEALLSGNSIAKLRLLIRIPEESRERESEIWVSQFYEGAEVGRVTWRLVPRGQDQ
jgi:serine protease